MSAFLPFVEEWLLRSAVGGSVILFGGLLLMHAVRQPARRQRLGEFALASSLLVAALCMLPAWSGVSLGFWPAAKTSADVRIKTGINGDSSVAMPINLQRRLASGDDTQRDGDDADLSATWASATSQPDQPDGADSLIAGGYAPGASGLKVVATSAWWRIAPWIGRLYVLMLVVLFARFLLGYVGLARLRRASEPAPERATQLLALLTPGWSSRPCLRVCRRLTSPVSFGLLRPTILLPPTFCRRGQEAGLRSVLVHELTHLERRDALGCVMLALAQPLYFYLPWYWWLRRQIRLCQEYVADAAAAALSSSEDYAEYLMTLSALGPQRAQAGAGAIGVLGSSSDLLRRITMLLNAEERVERRCPAWWSLGAATGFVAVAVLLSGLGLRAQAAPLADDDAKKGAKTEQKKDVDVILKFDEKDKKPVKVIKPGKTDQKDVIEFVVVPEGGDDEHVVILKDGKPEKRRIIRAKPGLDKEKIKALIQAHVKDGKVCEDCQKVVVIEGKGDAKGAAVIREIPHGKHAIKKGDVLHEIVDFVPGQPIKLQGKVLGDSDDVIVVTFDDKEDAKKKDATKEKIREEALNKYRAAIKALDGDQMKAIQDAVKKAQDLAGKAGEQGWEEAKKQLDEAAKQLEKARRDMEVQMKKAHAEADKTKRDVEVQMKKAHAEADKARSSAASKLAEAAKQKYTVTSSATATSGTRLGIMISTLGEDVRAQLDLAKDQGMGVADVVDDSPAAKAGFHKHDIILDFNGTALTSNVADFVKAVQAAPAGEKLSAVVLRKGKKVAIRGIVLPEAAKTPKKIDFDGAVQEKGKTKLDINTDIQEKLKGLKDLKELKDLDLKGLKGLEGLKELDLKGLKDLKDIKELDLKGLKDIKIHPVPPAVPQVPGGDRLKLLTGKGGQSVVTTIVRNDDEFKARYQEGSLAISVTGTVAGNKAKVSEIVVNDSGAEKKYGSVDNVAEKYRDKVKSLLESTTQGQTKVEVRSKKEKEKEKD